MNVKSILSVILLCILLFGSQNLICFGMPDIDTRNPTDTAGWGWNFPTRAYASDDSCTTSLSSGAQQVYRDYGFELSGATITKVEFGFESAVEMNPIYEKVRLRYSVDGGSSWTFVASAPMHTAPFCSKAVLTYYDKTSDRTWTPDLLANGNLETRIEYYYTAPSIIQPKSGNSESLPLDSEVGLWDGSLCKVKDLKKGDVLLGWNEKEFINATIEDLNIIEGDFDVLGIYSFHIEKKLAKYIRITHNTLMPFSKDKFNSFISDAPKIINEKRANNFQIGDYIFGYVGGLIWNNMTLQPSFECYQVKDIQSHKVSRVVQIKTNVKWIFAHHELNTGYVDSLPIRVTYIPPTEYTITYYIYVGGSLLVNGTNIVNGSSHDYIEYTVLSLLAIVDVCYRFDNFTYDSSSTTDNPFILNVTQNFIVHTYFASEIYICFVGLMLISILTLSTMAFTVYYKKTR